MLKPHGTKEQKFKRVPTTSFLLQSDWRGDINTLEPFRKKRHQGMKEAHRKNYGKTAK